MYRQAQRVAAVMSGRPAWRNAPMARFLREAMTRGPKRVRTREWSGSVSGEVRPRKRPYSRPRQPTGVLRVGHGAQVECPARVACGPARAA